MLVDYIILGELCNISGAMLHILENYIALAELC